MLKNKTELELIYKNLAIVAKNYLSAFDEMEGLVLSRHATQQTLVKSTVWNDGKEDVHYTMISDMIKGTGLVPAATASLRGNHSKTIGAYLNVGSFYIMIYRRNNGLYRVSVTDKPLRTLNRMEGCTFKSILQEHVNI